MPAAVQKIQRRLIANGTGDFSLVAVDKFILATRDSGYQGTESAVAELVDNAVQAGARRIVVNITADGEEGPDPLRIMVQDDGSGMDRRTLRQALRFGGSTRFNDRSGLGRYGMGLPNSSLSQARRVEVYSWQSNRSPWSTFLDVDEVAAGRMLEVPEPKLSRFPEWFEKPKSQSGTLVIWRRCDRLDHRRPGTIARKLHVPLGQIFRFFLWNKLEIVVNGIPVEPIDPLYLHHRSARKGGRIFGKPLEYEIEARASSGEICGVGKVMVTFSELPVHDWHDLSNEEKRIRGITNGAGVSVVRADREIDYGWFFMSGKRRENYDDWWRCEIRFDPILDEAFGITHTKQQIRPQEYLQEILSADLESQAKALNGRVRQAHVQLRSSERTVAIERLASERDELLRPLPSQSSGAKDLALIEKLAKRHPTLREAALSESGSMQYRIIQEEMKDTSFFSFAVKDGLFVLVLNPEHAFYRKLYKQLLEDDSKEGQVLRGQIDLLLLAAARGEAAATTNNQRDVMQQFRKSWSDNLATFLSK